MSQYTIETIVSEREFESKYGPLKSYKVRVQGDDGFNGEAEITQKPTTPAPQSGQVIEGTLDKSNPKFPPKLKKAQQPTGGGFKGGARSPKDSDSIERQVAYKGAVEMAVAFAKDGGEASEMLPGLFELSVKLIQGKAVPSKGTVEAVKDVFPGAEEVGPVPTHEALAEAYTRWRNSMAAVGHGEDEITRLFDTKKTALGFAQWDDATDDQKRGLLEFLTSEVA
jgi:hypothetical protein